MEPKFQNLNMQKLDADESAFFARELEYVKAKSYDKKYADLKARMLLPMSSDAGEWAESSVYVQYDSVGMAKLITSYADDIPRSDVKGKQFIHPVVSMASGYGYSIQEIRASRAKGKNLEQRKANSAKRAMMELENRLAFLGDSSVGLNGFLNHPNMPEAVIKNDNTSSQKPWTDANGVALKSGAQIIRDMHLVCNSVVDNSLGKETPDTLLLPRSRFLYISSTPWSTSTEAMTILEVFMKQSLYVKNVEWLNELEIAGAGSTKRMIAYRKDPDAVTMEVPKDFEQFAPEVHNLEYKVSCHQRYGGVLFYCPLSACFADGL
jgi:hypothetical protein